ncbi:AI-2E family transporter [Bacillus kwashiorkori]|uniref:AI-2E family transporter n=1 Tax=Bacillus kwashiorkori TaxID=1522318 RepID=UPI000781D165|nr:AI-2E family transporter [Bacillus kwashiorkori]
MDIKVKWFYRLGFLLLLFIVLFIFFKLQPYWQPILHILLSAIFPFVIAAFITYLLQPLVRGLHKNGLPKWLSVLIIYLLFFGGVGFLIYKGIPIFINQLNDLSKNTPLLINQYENWAVWIENKTNNWPIGIQEQIEHGFEAINNGIERFAEKTLKFVFAVFNSLFIIILIPFIAFYMIKDSDYLADFFWYIVPNKWRNETRRFIENVNESLGNYIRGQLMVCGLIGVVSSVLFWLIDLKYPLLLGFIVGATNVIPYFGPIIGAIPAVIIAATTSVKLVIFVIIIIFVLQFIEGNILSPLIVGKSLKMHPLLIMFSILLGGEVGGVIGLIVAVPIVAIIKTAILQYYKVFPARTEN